MTTIRFAALLAVLALAGCGTPRMRPANPGELIEVPPEGKALVNFHRPSDYGGHRLYAIFDSETFVGNNFGEQSFQYVCDPGVHNFIGYLTSDWFATVSVIQATLEAGQVYDCIVDSGYFTSSIGVNPLKKGEERRSEIPEWVEDDEDLLIRDEASGYQNYEEDMRDRNLEILADFVNGEKKDRLKILGPEDARQPGEFAQED